MQKDVQSDEIRHGLKPVVIIFWLSSNRQKKWSGHFNVFFQTIRLHLVCFFHGIKKKKKRERQVSGSEENNLGGWRNSKMSVLPCCKCSVGVVMHSAALWGALLKCYLHLQDPSFDHQHCLCWDLRGAVRKKMLKVQYAAFGAWY